jgi:hypothetical protein
MSSKIIAWIVALVLVGLAGWVLLGRSTDTRAQPQSLELRPIEVYNACPDPVWISYGRDAPLRPQDALVLNAGASSTSAMLEGDMVWLLDDGRAVVDHAGVGADTRQITVEETCRAVTARSPDV